MKSTIKRERKAEQSTVEIDGAMGTDRLSSSETIIHSLTHTHSGQMAHAELPILRPVFADNDPSPPLAHTQHADLRIEYTFG